MNRPPIGYAALRVGRVSAAGQVYFVTKIAQDRVRPDWSATEQQARGRLLQPGVPPILLASLDWLQQQQFVVLLAYCIMPDHVHLLFQLGDKATLSSVMQRFGSFTSRQIHEQLELAGTWMAGFHEHALRAETEMADIVGYIVQNPVKAGLVADAEAWPWSSAYRPTSDAAP